MRRCNIVVKCYATVISCVFSQLRFENKMNKPRNDKGTGVIETTTRLRHAALLWVCCGVCDPNLLQ